MLGVLAKVQRGLQVGSQKSGRLLTSNDRLVAGNNDGAQVTQIEFLHIGLGCFGSVEPLGYSKLWQEVLGQLQNACRFDLLLTGGLQRVILLAERLAHGRDAAAQHLLSDGLVLFGQRRQHCVAMLTAGTQTLRLGLLWRFDERRAGRTLATIAFGSGRTRATVTFWAGRARRAVTVRTRAAGRTIPLGTGAPGRAVTVSTGATRSVAARPIGAITTIGTVTTITTWAAALGRQRLQHGFEVPTRTEHLQPLGLFAATLGRGDSKHGDAIEIEIGFRPVSVAYLGIGGKQSPVKDSLRFTGADGTPGPGAVTTITGEFEFNPAGHGDQR